MEIALKSIDGIKFKTEVGRRKKKERTTRILLQYERGSKRNDGGSIHSDIMKMKEQRREKSEQRRIK